MDAIGKLDTDARKTLKRGGTPEDVAKLFVAASPALASVPETMAELWLRSHSGNLDWLAEALAFLLGTDAGLPEAALSAEDWQEVAETVSAEAEELPLEALTRMMQEFVAKGLV